MSKALDELKSTLYAEKHIDERKLFSFAMAQQLPSGAYGPCAIGINGDKLIIFDAQPSSPVGIVKNVMFEIPMAEIEDFKTGKQMLIVPYMKFTWQGGQFMLKNFGNFGVDKAVAAAVNSRQ